MEMILFVFQRRCLILSVLKIASQCQRFVYKLVYGTRNIRCLCNNVAAGRRML